MGAYNDALAKSRCECLAGILVCILSKLTWAMIAFELYAVNAYWAIICIALLLAIVSAFTMWLYAIRYCLY